LARILHIIESLGYTGTASQLQLVARGLAASGFDMHVCALRGDAKKTQRQLDARSAGDSESAAADITFHSVGRRWAIDPVADCRLIRLVRRLRPEIVHTWDCVAGMIGPLAASVGSSRRPLGSEKTDKIVGPARPRIVAGIHHIERWLPPWESFWERRFAPHVDRFVTNSSTVKDWCVRRGLPATKFAVIPPGVPPSRTSDVTREELLRELRLPADARLIGVVGRLVPDKRVQDLIWAADLLRVLHDNLRLLVIGDGPLRRQLERYARLASDLEHIQFLGERGDVERIMPHLDVLWNASENRGLSIAILEAMVAGVPVIAGDTPCNRELVVEGETGSLVPLRSRAGRATRARWTDRIFTDAEFVARTAAISRQRVVEHFSAERMVSRSAAIYEDLLR
jgi:glycosyltransferase involved in cell wall biosynthesis